MLPHLNLIVVPDNGGGAARASLKKLRLSCWETVKAFQHRAISNRRSHKTSAKLLAASRSRVSPNGAKSPSPAVCGMISAMASVPYKEVVVALLSTNYADVKHTVESTFATAAKVPELSRSYVKDPAVHRALVPSNEQSVFMPR